MTSADVWAPLILMNKVDLSAKVGCAVQFAFSDVEVLKFIEITEHYNNSRFSKDRFPLCMSYFVQHK